MAKLPDEYELSESDIDSVLRWLKIHDPANATSEEAIKFLVDSRVLIHEVAHNHPEKLEDLYKEYRVKTSKAK
jgi:competence protein ComGC